MTWGRASLGSSVVEFKIWRATIRRGTVAHELQGGFALHVVAKVRVPRPGFVRQHERIADHGVVVIDHVGIAFADDAWTAKIFLHASSNLRNAIVRPLCVSTTQRPQLLGHAVGDRNPAENRRFAHLGESHERERADEIQSAREAGKLGHALVTVRCGSRYPSVPLPDSNNQSRPHANAASAASTSRWRSFHRSARRATRRRAPCRPASRWLVGVSLRRHKTRCAVDECHSIQMTAIVGGQFCDERRLPTRYETMNGWRVQRQENRVFTNQSSSPPPQAISWI